MLSQQQFFDEEISGQELKEESYDEEIIIEPEFPSDELEDVPYPNEPEDLTEA